ncbi:MAG: MCE family protein [Nitrospinae bacterium]|nr:MCE family protein [Nitrospinota bacterium]
MKMHYSHRLSASQKEKVVGLFIIIPIIILLIVFIFIGRTKHFFEEKYKIKAVFKEGEGLKAGIPIILSGIDIGAIKSVQLNEQNQVEAILEIRKVYQNKIRNDSKATVAKAGFIGEQRIKIYPGSVSLPIIPNGGSITVEEGMAMEDMVNRVKPVLENVEKTLNKIAEITGNIPSTATSDILGNIKSITEDIKKGKGTAGAILTERELYNNINETVKKADTAMQKINDILVKVDNTSSHLPEITQTVRKELPPILEDIKVTLKSIKEALGSLPDILDSTKKTIKDVQQITSEIPPMIDSSKIAVKNIEDATSRLPSVIETVEKITKNVKDASDEMPEIARSARESTEDANNIIKGAKNSWPIKNFVEEEKERKIPLGERTQHE